MLILGVVSFLSLTIAACGSADESVTVESPVEDAEEQERPAFRLVLAGAAADTLRGNAVFGKIFNARTSMQHFILKMETGIDMVGGFFIVHDDTARPEARSYRLANVAEFPDSSGANHIYVVYQEGMLRQLRSREGTVTFTHVSDTLISGSIDATLSGHVGTGRGGQLRPGEVHVSGRFDASAGAVGFIVGI